MPPPLSATYDERHDAERVRERLVTIGVDQGAINLTDERTATGGPGIFDRLAELLAPAAAAKPRWLLSAEVTPDLAERARSALQGGSTWSEPEGRIEERTYVFRETRERLVVEKQAIVREELVLAPRTEERVEQIHDTVRRMDADVDRLEPASAGQKGSIPK
jgi:hypothetical protein